MKKSVHTEGYLALFTLIGALTGALLRRWQLSHELLSEGNLAPGSHMHIALTILSAVMLVGMIALLLPMQKKERLEQVFSAAVAPNLLQLLCAVCLTVGNILLWVEGRRPTTAFASRSPAVSSALAAAMPPLGILAAVCIACFALLSLLRRRPSPLLYMSASVYLVVRLIVCFQEWNTDPSIHDYAFQLLATICCMLATFQLSGFCFDRGKRRMCLFWSLSAVLFCAITAPDTLRGGRMDEILINGALLLSMAVSSAQLLLGTRKRLGGSGNLGQ